VNTAAGALTSEELELFNQLLERQFGLVFAREKREILEARLRLRLTALGLESFKDYYLLLQASPDGELGQLANAVTNNETYFFREAYQFQALYQEAMPLLASGAVVPGTLRVLSAGCSSGEEAYSLRFCRWEFGGSAPAVETVINAFDIDPVRVDIARRGEYRTRSLREMTELQTRRYLLATGPEQYRVRPGYREGVSFACGNIVDVQTFERPLPYDVLFCRNTLIYFSQHAQRQAVENFAKVLRPNGLLFLGHAESIIGISDMFETVRLGACLAYRRVEP
jgi:chemotaxis protein methyltransferase CheR